MRRPSFIPGPAKTPNRSAIRFVVGGFENEGNVERARDALDDLRHAQGVLLAFDYAGASDQKEVARAHAHIIDLERCAQDISLGTETARTPMRPANSPILAPLPLWAAGTSRLPPLAADLSGSAHAHTKRPRTI